MKEHKGIQKMLILPESRCVDNNLYMTCKEAKEFAQDLLRGVEEAYDHGDHVVTLIVGKCHTNYYIKPKIQEPRGRL